MDESFTTSPLTIDGADSWSGDLIEVEAALGRVFIYAHGEEVPVGWLQTIKRQVGRWFGY
jgi:hypothetical protein